MNPGKFYNDTLLEKEAEKNSVSRKSRIISILRVAVFVPSIIEIVYLLNLRELQSSILLTILLVLVMGLLIRFHNRIKRQLQITNNTIKILKRELNRLKLNFNNCESGEEFNEERHPYSSDLDLFGTKSIFQLIDQTTSFFGKSTLAKWLKTNASVEVIRERQKSAQELASHQKWCLIYRSIGLTEQLTERQVEEFGNWIKEAPQIINNKSINILKWLLPAILVLVAAGAYLFDYTYYFTLPILVISGILLNKHAEYAKSTGERTFETLNTLKVLSHQLKLLEKSSFKSEYLDVLKGNVSDPEKASESIQSLHRLLDRLQSRNNKLHIVINVVFLLDIWSLIALENWKIKNASNVDNWLKTLAEMEALISLSGVYFNFPEWVTPEFSNNAFDFEALSIAHPMLSEKAVSNNFSFSGTGKTYLITGPNMAGKSTFLRTVATNWILAQTGAPVRAQKFTIDPSVQVFTAMRVKDNLNESVSSFYAELDRIKQLIDRIKEGEKCLYFLDELLKGTNSADRHKGAESLIRQLHSLDVTGFVSTHDLELGALASKENYVHNYSFESTIQNGNITFDYTIRDGISSSFNACELMRKMGIEI